jgi:LysM repeat protein
MATVRFDRGVFTPLVVVIIGVAVGVAIAGIPSRHGDRVLRSAGATTTTSTLVPTTTTTTVLPVATTGAPVTTTTTVAPPVTYRVVRGDTLSAIAQRFRVPISAIVAANKIGNADLISEGSVLTIPRAGS